MIVLPMFVIFYFMDLVIAPFAHIVYLNKGQSAMDDIEEGQDASIQYELGESFHMVLERIAWVWVLSGCLLSSDGVPYTTVLLCLLFQKFFITPLKNQTLKIWLYRVNSLVAIYIILSTYGRVWLGHHRVFL